MTGVPHVDTRRWRSILRRELPQIARIVFVAAVAWQICLSLGATQPPLYAALVPLVSLRDDPFSAFNLSLARLVGVVAGLTIAIGVLAVLRPTTAAIAAVLAAALLVGVVLRIGDVLNTQVAVSAMLVLARPTRPTTRRPVSGRLEWARPRRSCSRPSSSPPTR